MTHHDSEIRSDLLPIGTGRTTADRFKSALEERLQRAGYENDYSSRSSGSHGGRRDFTSCDRVSITSPGGWKATHDGSATLKVRGCTHFRRTARALAHEISAEMGLRWN